MGALYAAIWRLTWRRQLPLIALAFAVAALAPVPLGYQKEIVNGLSGLDAASGSFSARELYALGAELVGFVLLSLVLKWALALWSGTLGESVIRAIRGRLARDYANQTAPDGARVAPGAVATALSAEAEELGRFAGDAIAQPLLQLGVLVSVVGFIGATQPRLGLLILLIILPQAIIVALTQRRVNRLVGERVRLLRGATDKVLREGAASLLEEIAAAFDAIYETRRRVFAIKFSTKFALSAIDGVGAALLLMLGGWLVIEGRSDVGTVVAAMSGLARVGAPWRLTVAFYRNVSAMRVKYEMLRELLDRMAHDAAAPGRGGPAP